MVLKCNICGNDTNKHFSFQLRMIYICDHCGLEFLYPQLTDFEIELLYSANYYESWGIGRSNEGSLKDMKKSTARLRFQLIKENIPNGKLLDVGCAMGFFLEEALKEGFDPYGIELSSYSAGIASEKFGSGKIFQGIIENCHFPDKMFDVIIMLDFLEHVRDPELVLRKASSLLRENGLVLITTPDTGSLTHRIMGKKWLHYKNEHFY